MIGVGFTTQIKAIKQVASKTRLVNDKADTCTPESRGWTTSEPSWKRLWHCKAAQTSTGNMSESVVSISMEIKLKVSMHSEKCRKEVMKAVAKLSGVDQVSVDLEKEMLEVTGDVDPVCVATSLRKKGRSVKFESVGPKKDEEITPQSPTLNSNTPYLNTPYDYGCYAPVYQPSRHVEGCIIL
ncbi:hypothetical protein R6Q59_018452 [Mikania micrantha]